MRCFSCNAESELGPGERVGFRDSCERCGVDLHVCRNCAHHDPSAYNECREANSEWVGDRERANRCDWFSAGNREGGQGDASHQRARSDLENLFKKS